MPRKTHSLHSDRISRHLPEPLAQKVAGNLEQYPGLRYAGGVLYLSAEEAYYRGVEIRCMPKGGFKVPKRYARFVQRTLRDARGLIDDGLDGRV